MLIPVQDSDEQSLNRAAPKPLSPHEPVPALTLKREIVKQPAAQPLANVVLSHSPEEDSLRQQRAKLTSQSEGIEHFVPTAMNFQSTPGQSAPAPGATPLEAPPPVLGTAEPKPAAPVTNTALFEKALRAVAHVEPPTIKPVKQSSSSKYQAIAGVAVLVLIAAAFLGTKGINDVKLHLASASAGFRVHLPDYQPSGYSLAKLSYGSGEAAAVFHSNSSSNTYSVFQENKVGDNYALIHSFVTSQDPNYQTITSNGVSIYLYDNGRDATFIKNGIWYIVNGNNTLSPGQITKLALSL